MTSWASMCYVTCVSPLSSELNKVCEQLNSKGSEQESDHRSMQSEALVEELQIMKSQCDRLTTEHQQSKSLCRQLESERGVSHVALWERW